jgi:thiol-disulfide isomerase/thioredoxin
MTKPSGKPERIWMLIALAFIVFWILYLALLGPRRSVQSLEDSGMSRPADFDWTVLDLKDEPVQFSRFKGKTVFLNIWATWCGPCVQEMPSIARLAEDPRLQGKGIEFVCVSTDDSSKTVRRFLEGRSWGMTFLRAQELPAVFSTEGIPATFIIAPNGRIAAAQVGSDRWDTPRVVAYLEKIANINPLP